MTKVKLTLGLVGILAILVLGIGYGNAKLACDRSESAFGVQVKLDEASARRAHRRILIDPPALDVIDMEAEQANYKAAHEIVADVKCGGVIPGVTE
jgi:hypothetical protein